MQVLKDKKVIVTGASGLLGSAIRKELGEDNEHEYLRVYVGHLRQKIEENPSKPKYIVTKRGIGYSFEG